MMVRPKKSRPTHKGAEPTRKRIAQPFTFPAPVAGWVEASSVLQSRPDQARLLDNWICTDTGARIRGGRALHATLDDEVRSLMTYRSGTETLFAATDNKIFDVTSPASATVAPTPAVTSLTSGEFSSVQFGNSGGDYLYAVNGVNAAQIFNGTAWQTVTGASSPVAITGVTTSTLSHVWTHANRIWFVEGGSTSAWYLAVDAIGGAATEFPLAGVFTRGGSLLFGATWSLDAGDGLDDKCVFVSDQGEVAVYEGSDPSSSSTWAKVGVYNIPRPLGKKAHLRAGGDLLIATVQGVIPVSAALRNDIAALEAQAISRAIPEYWRNRAAAIASKSWEMEKASESGVMMVSQPDLTGVTQSSLMVNLVTGAWSRATGWDVQCLTRFDDTVYFGSLDYGVYVSDSGGSDNGSAFTASYIGQFSDMGAQGREKSARQMRPMFQSPFEVTAKVTGKADFDETLPPAPPVTSLSALSGWDVSTWGSMIWDDGAPSLAQGLWYQVGVEGTYLAPCVQVTVNSAQKPDIELIGTDTQFFAGHSSHENGMASGGCRLGVEAHSGS